MKPELTEKPWADLPARTARALIQAGHDTPAKVARLGGRELRAVPGVGPKGYRAVRSIWPDPSGGGLREGATGHANLQTGNPGNLGGDGRPASRVREAATLEFEKRIPLLGELADNTDVATPDRLRAVDLLGKYGPGTRREIEHALDWDGTLELMNELAAAVDRCVMDQDEKDRLVGEWKDILRRHFGVVQ